MIFQSPPLSNTYGFSAFCLTSMSFNSSERDICLERFSCVPSELREDAKDDLRCVDKQHTLVTPRCSLSLQTLGPQELRPFRPCACGSLGSVLGCGGLRVQSVRSEKARRQFAYEVKLAYDLLCKLYRLHVPMQAWRCVSGSSSHTSFTNGLITPSLSHTT